VFSQTKKGGGIVYLKPTPNQALTDLQKLLVSIYPQCKAQDKGGWKPHLTVGRPQSIEERSTAANHLEKEWIPISFKVKEIYIFSRVGHEPYQVRKVISLGPSPSAPHYPEIPF